MKKILKAIFVLVFMGIGILTFSAAATTTNFSAESSVAAESAIPAKAIYVRNCQRCHDKDGSSRTELGQTLDAPDISGKGNIQVITKGKGAMPGFGKKLKKADIVALANYVRTL